MIKINKKRILKLNNLCNLKFFFTILLYSILISLSNCARLGSPVGGDKDTIPPRFLRAFPDTFSVNVAKNLKSIRLDFDEYLELKDLQKNLVISPDLKINKVIPGQFPSKYIYIEWSDSLKTNTTYNFNFGNAIIDHNEKNVLPYFQYVFSTGNKLDSLGVSGYAKLVKENKDQKHNILVALYPQKDSIDYRKKASYTTKTDSDNYFEIAYVSKGKYQLIAFDDENSNGVFDSPKENIAFLDNTLELNEIKRNIKLNLYPNYIPERFIEGKSQLGGLLFLFEGKPKEVKIAAVESPISDFKIQHKSRSDSAFVYFPHDINFEKQGQNMKWSYNIEGKSDTISFFFKSLPKPELFLSNQIGEKIPPQSDFEISSNLPINHFDSSEWELKEDNKKIDFIANVSKINNNKLLVKANFVSGKKYQLLITKESLSSYYHNNNKAIQFQFEVAKKEDFGKFNLDIINPPKSSFWLVLMLDSGLKISKYLAKSTSKITFDLLKPGNYEFEIIEDTNENGKYDGVQFSKKIQAEKTHYLGKKINIRPLWEINETWDLATENFENPGNLIE